MQDDGAMDTRPDHRNSGRNSPRSGDIRQIVSDRIDDLMRLDVTVANYHRLLRTRKMGDTVHAYVIVEEVFQKYVGRLLPVGGDPETTHKITEVQYGFLVPSPW